MSGLIGLMFCSLALILAAYLFWKTTNDLHKRIDNLSEFTVKHLQRLMDEIYKEK